MRSSTFGTLSLPGTSCASFPGGVERQLVWRGTISEMSREPGSTDDPRRALVEYQELLKNRTEEYDEAKAALVTTGDMETVRKLSQDFGRWRSEYKRMGEAKGYRQAGVALSTNMWFHWGHIAFDAERAAKSAGNEYKATGGRSDPTDSLGRAFRSSSVAIVAAAFMVEGLYGSVCYFVPPVSGRRRWSIILRTLRMLFDLSRVRRLDQGIEQLFGLRDDAAHPWVAVRPPQLHPYGFTNTSVEIATYTPEVASQSIDLACQLITQCTLHPVQNSRSAKRWAQDNREGVQRLVALRG